jgi:hypothetical protein
MRRRKPTKAELKARRSATAVVSTVRQDERITVRFHQPPGEVLHTLARELEAVPIETREAIAREVRAVEIKSARAGGYCVVRALQSQRVIAKHTGLMVPMCFGAMVYRCGPHEGRDVVAFCGAGNDVRISRTGGYMGHCWLAAGNLMIDFSTGDWILSDEEERAAYFRDLKRQELEELGRTLGEPVIRVRPTEYVWERHLTPGGFCEPWRPDGTPSLGRAYYKPLGRMPDEFIGQMLVSAKKIADDIENTFGAFAGKNGITYTMVLP